jgi:transposase
MSTSETITACRLKWLGSEWQKEIRQFGTMTNDLLGLSDWLVREGCTHVAMESSGVYWKPVYNILEGQFDWLVVNAQHLKTVPGRKTDVRDAEWIAELLAHGLLRGSFVPPPSVRQLRELTRYRTSVVRDRARTINRLQGAGGGQHQVGERGQRHPRRLGAADAGGAGGRRERH